MDLRAIAAPGMIGPLSAQPHGLPEQQRQRRADALALLAESGVRSYPSWIAELRHKSPPASIAAAMPMNTFDRARHLSSFASAPIETTIMPWRITIAAFSSATFPDDTAGSPKRSTMDFASPQSPSWSRLDGFFATAPNSSAPASSFFPIVGSGSHHGSHHGSHLGANQSGPHRARRCQRPTPGPRQLHRREHASIGMGDRSAKCQTEKSLLRAKCFPLFP